MFNFAGRLSFSSIRWNWHIFGSNGKRRNSTNERDEDGMGSLCSSGPVLLRYLCWTIFVAFCFHCLYPCFFLLHWNLLFCSPWYCFAYRVGRIESLKTKIFALCCTQRTWVLWISALNISCLRIHIYFCCLFISKYFHSSFDDVPYLHYH